MSLSVDIRHSFGEFSLDVTFEAPSGVTALFGRSGAGKSAIIRILAGLLRPDFAVIRLGDRILQDSRSGLWLPPEKRRLGVVFQDSRLFPHMSVARNLTYGFRNRDCTLPTNPEDVVHLLDLRPLLERGVATLSGGEQQRVAIGRMLLSAPEAILADEPLAALDAGRKADILGYFERLRDHFGLPMLYVSHAPTEVARLAGHVVAVERGRVAKTGAPSEILGDPHLRPDGIRLAGSVVKTRVRAHHGDGLTELSLEDQSLFLPTVAHEPGTELRVFVAAQDITIALDHPVQTSALNILGATITEIEPGHGPGALVHLKIGTETLIARITKRSLATLALAPGQRVYAMLKAVSIPQDGSFL